MLRPSPLSLLFPATKGNSTELYSVREAMALP